MSEAMHPIYTWIPKRSFTAIVGRDPQTLPAVLRALAVDPLEAADIRASRARKKVDASFAFFEDRGRIFQALQTISQWALQQKITEDMREKISRGDEQWETAPRVLMGIWRWEPRLAVWCAGKIGLKFLPMFSSIRYVDEDGEQMSLPLQQENQWERALRAVDSWVRGRASTADIKQVYSSFRRYDFILASMIRANSIVINALDLIVDGGYSTFPGEPVYHIGFEASSILWNTSVKESDVPAMQDRINAELTQIIADACMTFPITGAARASGAVRARSLLPAAAVGALLGAGAMHFRRRP